MSDRRLRGYGIVIAVAALAVTLLSGFQHDYIAYDATWRAFVASGGREADLAYGPAFVLFAIPWAVHPLLPKVISTAVWLGTSWWLVRGFQEPRWARLAFVALFLNPFFWIHTAIYGTLDVVVASAALAAVVSHQRGKAGTGGVWLAAATLIKIYPGALAGFLARARGSARVELRFMAASGTLLGVGGAIAWLLWGDGALQPVVYAAERPSNHLSIFRFLRSRWSPVGALGGPENLDSWSVPVTALAWLATMLWAWRRRVPAVTASLVGLVVVLQLYKVGHVQFQALVVFLLVLMFTATPAIRRTDSRVARASGLYVLALAVYSSAYEATRILTGERFGFEGIFWGLNPFLSIPMLVVVVWLVTELVREPSLRHET